jgi:hypothetical protein
MRSLVIATVALAVAGGSSSPAAVAATPVQSSAVNADQLTLPRPSLSTAQLFRSSPRPAAHVGQRITTTPKGPHMNRNTVAGLTAIFAISSLAAPLAAAAGDALKPADPRTTPRARPTLDTSLDRQSARGVYRVRVASLEQPMSLRQLHDWSLVIEHDGKPVEDAVVLVGGGMPQHHHGYPTKPTVEAAPGGGYVIRGMKFSMRGWWELKLKIQSPAGADQVTFNVVL